MGDEDIHVLKNINLDVPRGQIVSIIGPSGVGKSTLLNILGTLDNPTSGSLIIDDQEIDGLNEKELSSLRNIKIGFVFQFHHLLPEFTAQENVVMPAWIAGKDRDEALESGAQLLKEVGLAHRMHHKPERLSGGEQQRVAIAVALAHNPPLLLADEPTGELDSQSASSILDVFRTLNETYGVTIVIVTHDMSVTNKVQRVVTIRDGRTSLESVRETITDTDDSGAVEAFDEFIVLDGFGRLQNVAIERCISGFLGCHGDPFILDRAQGAHRRDSLRRR